jgi:hypothetical protein
MVVSIVDCRDVVVDPTADVALDEHNSGNEVQNDKRRVDEFP